MFGRISNAFTKRIDAVPEANSGNTAGYSAVGAPASTPAATSTTAVFAGTGGFYFKPTASGPFSLLSAGPSTAKIAILPTAPDALKRPQFKIVVIDDDDDEEPALEQPIADAMGMTFYHDSGAVMWHCLFDGNLRELCFRFSAGATASKGFVDAFNSSIYASLANPTVEKDTSKEDRAYIQNTYSHAAPVRAASPEASAPAPEAELFTFSQRDRSVVPTATAAGGGKNLAFADSAQYHRAIVLRSVAGGGTEARAMSYADGGFGGAGEAFSLTEQMAGLTIASDKDKQSLLSHDDKHLYALHSKGGILDVDLSRGEVVSEYQSAPGYSAIAITNQSKFASADPNMISCLGSNVAFSIDKRLDPTKCVVAEVGKDTSDYALKSLKGSFICSATSAKGQLVIGDALGDLRLYGGTPGSSRAAKGDAHPKTAKTLLKGSPGAAIVSVDITADGKYVVAATAEAVLVFPLEFTDGAKTSNGCDVRMGANKSDPLRLVPTPQQRAALGTKATFSRVRFDADPNAIGDQSAHWVVATCGEMILTWRMADVVAAVGTRATVQCDAASEGGAVLQIDVASAGEKITFMTEGSIGAEKRSAKPIKKGFSYLHF